MTPEEFDAHLLLLGFTKGKSEMYPDQDRWVADTWSIHTETRNYKDTLVVQKLTTGSKLFHDKTIHYTYEGVIKRVTS